MSEETYSTTFEEIIDSMPGRILPKRYRIDTLLSQNAHTAIFRTFYEPLDQVVILRLFKVRTHDEDYQFKRFVQEAKRLTGLKHPNVTKLIDHGILEEGIPYIVTENITGPTLEEVLNRTNRIDPDQMVILFTQIARAIQYGHEHGVLHESLKPSRIILFDDPESGDVVVKVNGLGFMALHLKLGVSLKTPAERQDFIGTGAYMSPEQCLQDKPMDGRSDVYSLGCMMYESLGGQPPFIANDPREVLNMQVHKQAVPLNVLRSELAIPKRLVSVVDKCLAKDHTRRYQFVRDLQTDLERDIDPSEREQQVQIPAGISKAHQRVKESFELPVKQLLFLFGGVLGLAAIAFVGLNTINVAGQFADMGIWQAKLDSGTKALQEGRIEDAGRDLEQSVREAKKFKAPDSRMAISLNQESNYFLAIGKTTEATNALKEALTIESGSKTDDGPVAADSYLFLARAQVASGKLAEAEKSALKAVELAEKNSKDSKDPIFNAYLQLAKVYVAEKKIDPAKKAVDQMSANAGSDARKTTEVTQMLALIDSAAGKHDAAMAKLQTVLGERQEKIGLDALPVVETMQEMGNVLAAAKKHDKSITILKTAYENKKKYYSEETPAMVNLNMQIGSLYEQLGKKDDAEKLYRQALEVSEKIWGERNKERLTYIDSFAKFLRKTGRISAAEVYEQEAREIRDPSKIPKIAQ